MKFWDDDTVTEVTWFRVPPGTPIFESPSVFRSFQWSKDVRFSPTNSGIGEQYPYSSDPCEYEWNPWFRGNKLNEAIPVTVCGSIETWRTGGIRGVTPEITVGPGGLCPHCLTPAQIMSGGIDFGTTCNVPVVLWENGFTGGAPPYLDYNGLADVGDLLFAVLLWEPAAVASILDSTWTRLATLYNATFSMGVWYKIAETPADLHADLDFTGTSFQFAFRGRCDDTSIAPTALGYDLGTGRVPLLPSWNVGASSVLFGTLGCPTAWVKNGPAFGKMLFRVNTNPFASTEIFELDEIDYWPGGETPPYAGTYCSGNFLALFWAVVRSGCAGQGGTASASLTMRGGVLIGGTATQAGGATGSLSMTGGFLAGGSSVQAGTTTTAQVMTGGALFGGSSPQAGHAPVGGNLTQDDGSLILLQTGDSLLWQG